MSPGLVVGTIGGLLLAHAAFSTIQYRSVLKITEDEFIGPPANVLFELLIGFALCFWASLTVPGRFISILLDSEENSISSFVEDTRVYFQIGLQSLAEERGGVKLFSLNEVCGDMVEEVE
ncbi:hypothetical protein AMTR_s00127p00039720 [Amborella trichopoda]|uniref:Uncharacterized protein n=1 Tax=Amborella trichopoda TaxID=13333 RepID=W1NNL0_AMBTC|nr:hypothetical protein AMTR_s00127p00039720 [Amborella trichopoda]